MGSNKLQEKSAGPASLGAGFREEIGSLKVLGVRELGAAPGGAPAPPAPGRQGQRFNSVAPGAPAKLPPACASAPRNLTRLAGEN